ncbi:alpha carbonic anhydrase 4-like [Camellia sinensis]|uniref:alpha carbonic anhydrase 4-like n=1 Tax=Camellia sinensis TaxID=4442 RepID=UPI00103615E9|nr:alpha carbonic anhydrase 4-like [Camellia sinensis]
MGFFTTTTTIINNSPRLIFSFFFIFFILSSHSLFSICNAFESEVEDETPFTYVEGTGKGPRKWGKVNPHWKSCGNGKLQSPIDVVDQRVKVFPNLGKLKKDYKPAPATLKNRGHDIAVEWKGDAGKININGTRYKLLQCHWHSPSEHTFNGTRYHLELHIVHLSSCGTIAVVGIVYKYGQPDPFLAKLINHIKSTDKERYLGIVNPGDIKFGSRKYYRYIGSLTVPPCTEGVIWTIVKKVRTVSRDQVQALRDAVHDGFEANARPIQQLDGRTIFLYNPGVSARSI